MRAGRRLGGAATITFDDGYAGVFAHAWPLLRDLGVPARVFVVAEAPEQRARFWWDHPDVARRTAPAPRERWLGDLGGDASRIASALALSPTMPARLPDSHRPAGWDAIAAVAAAGLDIGVHSPTPRTLSRLDNTELERAIVGGPATNAERLDTTPTLVASPYGAWG